MNIINVINNSNVPKWGNAKKYIVIHYLGVVGQNNKIESGGYGAHFYIYWDGTTYQAADLNAILWQVGTGGYYTQKHPEACNSNVIGIELCVKCDGNAKDAADPKWYFTEETQLACVELVKKLMKDLNIPADHVLRHYDVVNKRCPAPYVNNNKYRTSWTWDEFKARLTGSGSSSNTSSTTTTSSNDIPISVGSKGLSVVGADSLNVREAPTTSSNKLTSLKKGECIKADKRRIVNGVCWFHFVKGWVSGKYLEGWIKENNKWWYVNEGYTYTKNDWQKINGIWYFFDSNGYMVTGWVTKSGNKYYMNEDGSMHTGWLNLDNSLYYFKDTGAMVISSYIEIGGKPYCFLSNGKMATKIDSNGVLS